MASNSAHAVTIGEYLKRLLVTVWREGEFFSPVKPFGSCGWQTEVHTAMARAGHILGLFDLWDLLERADTVHANHLIAEAIEAMSVLPGDQRERNAVGIVATTTAMIEVYERLMMAEEVPDSDKPTAEQVLDAWRESLQDPT
ncbi:hypothetical protein ETD83_40405 [Actinomadura soli]|uniref:Uncharacterized protein n=1 Tax=Actinomadura soli TaxID=2508997 RepID=A0A5C4IZC9_9ACTN|nr:hypothetical protein [Actinomadura soli]TMQ86137.1 hypothetical protein ETD83_40405 [Actinomadura soli]